MKRSSLYYFAKKNDYYLSYYKPVDIPFDDTDYVITIDSKYNNKPGLLAKDIYGDERLGWVFSYFNREQINDIIFDLKTDMKIRIPTKERLNKYI